MFFELKNYETSNVGGFALEILLKLPFEILL